MLLDGREARRHRDRVHRLLAPVFNEVLAIGGLVHDDQHHHQPVVVIASLAADGQRVVHVQEEVAVARGV